MANEVNANIRVGLDSSDAIAGIRALQSQISDFNRSLISSNAAAVTAQKSLLSTLTAQVGATKQFTTSITNVETSVSRLGNAIDKNKLALGEYFKYGIASSRSFGRAFRKEQEQITALAEDRVKRLQTQYIALGEAQNGMTKAMAVRPMHLFNADAAIAVQKAQIFNKLLHDGSTSLINFGKNTQWAGRQLMVGFTIPLTIFGGIAAKTFMDLEKQVVKFRRVYGDAMTPASETNAMIGQIQELAKEYTKYGIAVSDTIGLASDAAAAGAKGQELVAATAQATRLGTLGMIDQQQALTATIALQSAFRLSSEELANSINFLNAVENQTVVSLDDITQAIPTVAPVIKGLGGDVQDLAIFMAAMREGGVNAAEGANALKSGLASLINPTKAAREQLSAVGINIDSILSKNKGDLRGIVMEFGAALGTLDKFSRQQILAKMFGKYQFARLGALFDNINRDGSQAQRVIDLTGQSLESLAGLADKELGQIEQAVSIKFTAAVEKLKLAIAPIGEAFLKIATPIIEFATKVFDKFNQLNPAIKNFGIILVAGLGVVVPTVIMLIGLFANFFGNAMKGFALMKNFFARLRGDASQVQYLSQAELDAAAAASSLEGKVSSLTSEFNVQKAALDGLIRSYQTYTQAAQAASTNLPNAAIRGPRTRRMASGGIVPGSGNSDTVPALLTPGESVVTKEATKRYAPVIMAMNKGKLPGFNDGIFNVGGRSFTARSQISAQAIQSRIDKALREGLASIDEIVHFFDTIATQAEQRTVKSLSRQGGVGETVFPSRRYSRPAKMENVETQLAGTEELRIAQGSAQAAVAEMKKFGATAEQLSDAALIARSHLVESVEGQKEWHRAFWEAQSQAENQFTNIVNQSPRNKEMYRRYILGLEDTVASEKQKYTILDKVSKNISLTEEEYQIQRVALEKMLADVQTNASLSKQVSKAFIPYAAGAVGAARWRANAGVGYAGPNEQEIAAARAAGESLADGGIKGVKTKQRSASDSKETTKLGNDFVNGYVHAIEKGSSQARQAGQQMTSGAVAGAATSDIRRVLAEQYGVGPLAQEARANQRRLLAMDKERESIIRRTANQIALTNRINIQSARVLAERQYFDELHQKALKENAEWERRAALSEEEAANDAQRRLAAVKQISKTPQNIGMDGDVGGKDGRGRRIGRRMFGGGGGKLLAISSAATMASFAGSSMGGTVGDISQKAIPALIAIDVITSLLQSFGVSLSSILPAISGLAGTIAGIAVPVALLGAAIISEKNRYEKAMNAAIENGNKFANSMNDAAEITNIFGKKFRSVPGPLQRYGANTKKKNQAEQYFSTEEGGKYVEQQRSKMQELGYQKFIESSSREIALAAATSGMSAKEIDAYVSTLAEKLGSKAIYTDIRANLVSLIDPKDGKDILEKGLLIPVTLEQSTKLLTEQFTGPNFEQTIADLQNLSSTILAPINPQQIFKQNSEELDKLKKQAKDILDSEILGPTNSDNKKLKEYTDKYGESEGIVRFQQEQKKQKIVYDDLMSQIKLIEDATNHMTETGTAGYDDQAASVENAIKSARAFSEKLIIGGHAMASLKAQYDKGDISLKQYTRNSKRLSDQMTVIATKARTTYQTLQEQNPQLATQFVTTISEQLLVGLPEEIQKNITDVLATVSESTKLELQIGLASGSITPDQLVALSKQIDGIPADVQSQIIIAYGNGSLRPDEIVWVKDNMDALSQLSDVEVKLIFSVFGTDNMATALSLMQQIATIQTALSTATGDERNLLLQQLAKARAAFAALPKDVLGNAGPTDDGGGNGNNEPPPGGAGAKSALQELIDSIMERLKLYTNYEDLLKKLKGKKDDVSKAINQATYAGSIPDQLRKMNLSEALIADILSKGSENAKKILQAMQERKGLAQQLNMADIVGRGNQALSDLVGGVRDQYAQRTAIGKMRQRGFNQSDIETVAQNADIARLVNVTKTKKGWEEVTKTIKAATDERIKFEMASDPTAFAEKILSLEKRQHDLAMRPAKMQIEAIKDQIKLVDDQIEAIQKLNDKDQQRIRGLERQRELLQRQLDAADRSNELDQRRIDSLQREDELRERVASALQHDLDILSKQEDKIRQAYQNRIDALNKVAEVNQHIINQQKQQLGLSQSLSQGDIYAATAQSLEARQSNAAFAAQQQQQGLQTGMENAVAGLRTAGGLTREQAQQQIANIEEQSYQTNLEIQKIQDVIYQRNLETLDVKDRMYNLDLSIRGVSDQIYDRESQILNIQNNIKDPLESQLNINQQLLDAEEQRFANHVDDQEALIEQAKITAEQDTLVRSLADSWYNVALQIDAANKLMNQQTAELKKPEFTGDPKKDLAALEAYKTAIADIRKKREDAVAAAYATGKDAMTSLPESIAMYKNKGGIIGYAAGSYVTGNGSRDSVPAMLTPGEFIVRKPMVDKYGLSMMERINTGSYELPTYKTYSRSTTLAPNGNNMQTISAPVYNGYNVNVNVSGSNASADEIANRTIMKIKEMKNVNIRGARG